MVEISETTQITGKPRQNNAGTINSVPTAPVNVALVKENKNNLKQDSNVALNLSKIDILMEAGRFKDSRLSYAFDTIRRTDPTIHLNASSLWWSIIGFYRNEDKSSVEYLQSVCPEFLTHHLEDLQPAYTVLWVVALIIDEYERAILTEEKVNEKELASKSQLAHINEYGTDVIVDTKATNSKRKSSLSLAFRQALEAKKKKNAIDNDQVTETNLFNIFKNKVLLSKNITSDSMIDLTLAITNALQQKIQMSLTQVLQLFDDEVKKFEMSYSSFVHECPISIAKQDIFRVPTECFTAFEKEKLTKFTKKAAKFAYLQPTIKLEEGKKLSKSCVPKIKTITSIDTTCASQPVILPIESAPITSTSITTLQQLSIKITIPQIAPPATNTSTSLLSTSSTTSPMSNYKICTSPATACAPSLSVKPSAQPPVLSPTPPLATVSISDAPTATLMNLHNIPIPLSLPAKPDELTSRPTPDESSSPPLHQDHHRINLTMPRDPRLRSGDSMIKQVKPSSGVSVQYEVDAQLNPPVG